MKVLKCPRCDKQQKDGKFCLDCGSLLVEIITKDVKFKPIETNRSTEQLKKDIRNWLSRIGVQQADIGIGESGGVVYVEYILDKSKQRIESYLQKDYRNNLAAIEQLLHYRVLGIERGIESIEKAFASYEMLPDPSRAKDPYEALGFTEPVSLEQAKSKFKQLAQLHHPDKQGSKEQFEAIVKAIRQIEEMQG